MTPECPRGHPREGNTRWFITREGKRKHICRKCVAQRVNARYRNDPTYRAVVLARVAEFNIVRRGWRPKPAHFPSTIISPFFIWISWKATAST